MKKFKSIQGDLAVEVYYDSSVEPTLNAIFLGGFPVFPGPNIFVERLVAAGFVVYYPQYYGSFDSNGTFTFSSMVATGVDTAAIVAEGEIAGAKSDFKPSSRKNVSLLVGHSFGGVAASYAAPSIDGLRQLIISSSGLRYSTPKNNTGLNEDFSIHLENVRSQWRNTYRLGDKKDWEHIISGDLPNASPKSSSIEDVCILIGGADGYFDSDRVIASNEEVLGLLLGRKEIIRGKVVSGAGHSPNSVYGSIDLKELGVLGFKP